MIFNLSKRELLIGGGCLVAGVAVGVTATNVYKGCVKTAMLEQAREQLGENNQNNNNNQQQNNNNNNKNQNNNKK